MAKAGRPMNTSQPVRVVKRPLRPLVSSLKRRRIQLDMTQSVLAERMGYNVGTLKKWEQGKYSPGSKALEDWAQALGLKLALEAAE